MVLQAVAFYALSVTMIVAAMSVVTQRNPVHAVLFLILTFFTAAGLFVLLGAEFNAHLFPKTQPALLQPAPAEEERLAAAGKSQSAG